MTITFVPSERVVIVFRETFITAVFNDDEIFFSTFNEDNCLNHAILFGKYPDACYPTILKQEEGVTEIELHSIFQYDIHIDDLDKNVTYELLSDLGCDFEFMMLTRESFTIDTDNEIPF